MFSWGKKKTPEEEAILARIDQAKPLIRQAGGSLVGSNPALVVDYGIKEDVKSRLIASLKPLGWEIAPEPGDEDAGLLTFRCLTITQEASNHRMES